MKPFRMLFRSIRDAFKSVIRNFSLSLASISCIAITLIVVAVSLILSFNVNNFTKVIKEDVTIVVFVNRDADVDKVKSIENKIKLLDNINSISYKSKADLKKEMEENSATLKNAMQDWDESENPLKDTFQVKVKDIERISETDDLIKKIDGVNSTNYGETMVNRFLQVFKVVEKGTIAAVLALIIVTVFLIINTIKLTIFSRKREISIMRLVGASNISIKLPFVFEGMLIGILGSILPIILVIYGYYSLFDIMNGKLLTDIFTLVPPSEIVFKIGAFILLIGAIVGMLGSSSAVKKYLKV